MKVLITGGAGFIGSHVVKHFIDLGHEICVATRNTYAAKHRGLADVLPTITLLHGDLAEPYFANQCAQWHPDWIIHMAAETHVDRSIADPACFVRSNVLGTTNLLHALWEDGHAALKVKKIVVYSTDEVFGSTPLGLCFDEQTPYNPSNAYAASKVAIEAMAHSFVVTHDMPILVVRPCNTYGPGQHPEKVIPKFVRQMLRGEPVTIYNDGKGARDWLHVQDHARAIQFLIEDGKPGESYNLAAGDEHTDQDIAYRIYLTLVECGLRSEGALKDWRYVPGRPGHDRRYWMDASKLRALGWQPEIPFTKGFRDTVLWNAQHQDWWETDEVRYAPSA